MKFFVVVRHLLSHFGSPLVWKSTRRRSPFGRLQVQQLEERRNFATDLETFDGTGNNLVNPNWGSAGSDLLRIAPAQYGDGVSTPAGADRPSARSISDAISAQVGDIINNRNLLIGWRTLFFKEGEYKPDPTKSVEWNRGAYLVEGLGHTVVVIPGEVTNVKLTNPNDLAILERVLA